MFFKRELLDLHKTQVDLMMELLRLGKFERLDKTEMSNALNGKSNGPKARAIRFESTKIIERWKSKDVQA